MGGYDEWGLVKKDKKMICFIGFIGIDGYGLVVVTVALELQFGSMN